MITTAITPRTREVGSGSREIPASVRADGSTRKAIKIKPGYRPPECDVDGGYINRLFDIWMMGCLFLEMITHLLGGRDLFLTIKTVNPWLRGSKKLYLYF